MASVIEDRRQGTERGAMDDAYAGRSWLNEQMLPGRSVGHGGRTTDANA